MTTSFYVWASSRWSVVDCKSGRVQGWRKRARFLYFSGGKLHLASTKAVLRGLCALAAGQPTSVRDGLSLSKRRPQRPSLSQRASLCKCHNHRHQCLTSHIDGEIIRYKAQKEVNFATAPATTETAVQVSLPAHSQRLTENAPRTSHKSVKRKRSVSPEPIVKRVTTQRSSSVELKLRASSEEVRPTQRSETPFFCKELVINEEDVDLYRSYLIKHDSEFDLYRFDTDESYKLSVFFRINPLVNIERCNLIRRMLRGSQASQLSLKDFASQLGLRSISDQESAQSRRYKMRSRKEREKQLKHTSDEEIDKENNSQFKLRKRPNQLEFRKRVPEVRHTERMNVVREKRVEESEHSSSSSTRSDADFVRKKKKFISINKIHAKHRLLDETNRIPMNRHNPIPSKDENVPTNIDKPQSNNGEIHINNIKNSLRKSKDPQSENAAQQNIKSTRQGDESVLAESVKKRPSFAKLSWSSSDSDAGVATGSRTPRLVSKPPRLAAKPPRPATKPTAVAAPANHPVFSKNAPSNSTNRKPKRGGAHGREYASLEDHAIVAYISSGNRASLVNGNRVWRQLQQDYQALSGTFRTWHSLRNRYLRYILPALPALALPPAHAARLRAAAARGEIKDKIKESRRQSIFTYPSVRSAFRARGRGRGRGRGGLEAETSESPSRALRSNADNDGNQRDRSLSQTDNTRKVPDDKNTRNAKTPDQSKDEQNKRLSRSQVRQSKIDKEQKTDKSSNAQLRDAHSKDEKKQNKRLSRSQVGQPRLPSKSEKDSKTDKSYNAQLQDISSDEENFQKSKDTRSNRSRNAVPNQSREQSRSKSRRSQHEILSDKPNEEERHQSKDRLSRSRDAKLVKPLERSGDGTKAKESDRDQKKQRTESSNKIQDEKSDQISKRNRLSRSRDAQHKMKKTSDKKRNTQRDESANHSNEDDSDQIQKSTQLSRSRNAQRDKSQERSNEQRRKNLRYDELLRDWASDQSSEEESEQSGEDSDQSDEESIQEEKSDLSDEDSDLSDEDSDHSDETHDRLLDELTDSESDKKTKTRPNMSRNKPQEESREKKRLKSEKSRKRHRDDSSDESSDEASNQNSKSTRLSRSHNKTHDKSHGDDNNQLSRSTRLSKSRNKSEEKSLNTRAQSETRRKQNNNSSNQIRIEDKDQKSRNTRHSRSHNKSQEQNRTKNRSQRGKTPSKYDESPEESGDEGFNQSIRTRLSRSLNKSRVQSRSKTRTQSEMRDSKSDRRIEKSPSKHNQSNPRSKTTNTDQETEQNKPETHHSGIKRLRNGRFSRASNADRSRLRRNGQSPAKGDSTPTYSELSRQFAERGKSTPNTHSHDNSVTHSPRKLRKLYNPKVGFG